MEVPFCTDIRRNERKQFTQMVQCGDYPLVGLLGIQGARKTAIIDTLGRKTVVFNGGTVSPAQKDDTPYYNSFIFVTVQKNIHYLHHF